MVFDSRFSSERLEQLSVLQRRLGYSFRNMELLDTALTHRSYANEGPRRSPHNERLEFLGDAVLGLVLSEQYYRELPEANEGELSKIRSRLVSASHLAKMARILELGAYLHLGKGEVSTGGRHKASLLANAFEALMGAIFLDGGYAGPPQNLYRSSLPARWIPIWISRASSRSSFNGRKGRSLPIRSSGKTVPNTRKFLKWLFQSKGAK